jgi:hypothetical protein
LRVKNTCATGGEAWKDDGHRPTSQSHEPAARPHNASPDHIAQGAWHPDLVTKTNTLSLMVIQAENQRRRLFN